MAAAQKPVEESATPAHDTAAPRNTVGPEQSHRVVETLFDPGREALARAAALDYQVRQNPAEWTRLPNGNAVRIQPGMPFKYPGDETHPMLDHPAGIWNDAQVVKGLAPWRLMRDENNETTSMLASPKPPYLFEGIPSPRYGWFVRTPAVKDDRRPAETAREHGRGRIRYIEVAELDRQCPFAMYEEYATPNNVYVTTGSMILAEIMDPRLSYQKYKGWDDQAIERVRTVDRTVQTSPSVMTDAGPVSTHIPGKTVMESTGPSDSKRGG